MGRKDARRGATNHLYVMVMVALVALGLLSFLLYRSAKPPHSGSQRELFVFCAAGMRYPMERIAEQYQQRYGIAIQLQYGGSNTLLNQLEVARSGDLYLAADDTYIQLAREKGLVAEVIPLARIRPVLVVPKGNPKKLEALNDLLRDDLVVALGSPEAAAIGRTTRLVLEASGLWDEVKARVTERGVFKPTVNDVANDVKLGSVDVGIVWDSTVAQYPELEMLRTSEMDEVPARIEIAVLNSTQDATASLRFARFAAARNEGLKAFEDTGFEPVDGDLWEERPEITFFAGSVNRRALEPILMAFQEREGVRINTVYNGCGILTAQMRTILDERDGAFPDTYMACDVYYLETVQELFEEGVNVSDTDIVIAVAEGNPKGIQGLPDLIRPGIRVAIGQPEQCTIGVLTRRLLEREGIYEKLLESNVVTQTATSALLVPSVSTGAADAVLAYETDTLGEPDRVDVVRIDSPLSKAIQPYSIARSSEYKHLGQRLFRAIAQSQDVFESQGFHWRLDAEDEVSAPGGAELP